MSAAHHAHQSPDDPADHDARTAAGGPGDHRPQDQVGSVGEEAAKLFEAVSEALGVSAAHTEPSAAGAEECRWCPLCRLARQLHLNQPEVSEHLLSASRSLVAAASALLEFRAGGSPEPDERPEAHRESRARRVEHLHPDEDGPSGFHGPTGREEETR